MGTQAPEHIPPRNRRTLFLLVGVFVAVLFVALNVWVYIQATKQRVPPIVSLPRGSMNPDVRSSATQKTLVISFPSSLSPTPTPLQGPGEYACDPLGICNLYADPIGKRCPKTFADSMCLGRCSDKSIQCPD